MPAFAHTMQGLAHPSLQREPGLTPAKSPRFSPHSNDDRSGVARAPEQWLVGPFNPISLEQLNAKAAMLERLDNKYVVRESALRQAIPGLARHFDILEIEGRRDFTYETCYFDDAEHTSYFDHHRGRRLRFKVRVRKYTDAQLCFVEVKLKDKRGITVKKRLDYAVDKYGTLDESARAHIRSAYSEIYGRDFNGGLEPVIEMRYQRMTLVAKQGGERMTIDRSLVFSRASRSCSIDARTFILETKSANANGIADKILRSLHQHPVRRCSKYCIGMATLQEVQKHNRFLPALRKLNVAPASRGNVERSQPLASRSAPAIRTSPALAPTTDSRAMTPDTGRRKRHLFLLTAALTMAGLLVAAGCEANTQGPVEANTSRLEMQSRFIIPAVEVNGIRVDELSGLAWDEDEQLLYAVSDKGNVFHFRLKLDGNAIVAAEPVYAAALVDPAANGPPRKRFNAEGLTAQNADNGKADDTVLVVSLEASDQPSIIRFSPTGVVMSGELSVPSPADDPRNYRKKGQGLESVAYHPEHGLMTAPESPLLAQPDNWHALYASDRHWSFARYSADSRLKAADMLADGNLLVLERCRLDSSGALTASVRKVNLVTCPLDGACSAEDVTVLPSGPSNFEGMTQLGNGRVLIVSDHGGKKDRHNTTLMLLTLE